jgi:penicillin G amidase
MSRSRRRLIAGLAIAVVVLPVPVAWIWLLTSRARVTGTIALTGLSDYVRIDRDSLGVPQVWAATEEDLLFAQGFLHAQDRLWQMELFRRVADGRLSEILGPAALETDRFLRVVGLGRAATAQDARLDPATRRRLDAYTAGVNAFIAQRRGALPPEFVALRFEPEPWTRRNTISVEKVMAWDLAPYGFSVEATRAVRALGPERAARLMPGYPEWGPTILEAPLPLPAPGPATALLDALSMTHASNAWVIGGSRTRSGKPILANDMHLSLRAPSIWYLMALHGGGFDVAGMSIPGAPYIVAGHNRAIAWGFTNAMLDDIDLFIEKVDPADSSRYLSAGGSEPFAVLRDSIRVKGRAEPVIQEIRVTRHGPILENVEDPQGQGLIALMFAGRQPSHTLDALRRFNAASGWADFVEAVRNFDNPHQNVVYADTIGKFGYIMGGRIPIRGNGRVPPVLPVPGWTGEWDWTGYEPFDDHPAVLNPASGYVVTANNRQAAGQGADRISTSWEPPYRAERIRSMILESKDLDVQAVHHMQLDLRDELAARHRGRASASAREAGLGTDADTLDAWDLRASRDSRGAALFYAWYESLDALVRHETFGDSAGTVPRSAIDAILDGAPVPWVSPVTVDSLSHSASRAADSIATGRTWGQIHHVRAEHTLAASRLLDGLFHLDIGGGPGDGAPTTVNVSLYAAGSLPTVAAYGPSQRHVVDMANVDDGGFIIPTGESGNPLDRHYRDQWTMWLEGGLWTIPLDFAAAKPRVVHTLKLEPAGR